MLSSGGMCIWMRGSDRLSRGQEGELVGSRWEEEWYWEEEVR